MIAFKVFRRTLIVAATLVSLTALLWLGLVAPAQAQGARPASPAVTFTAMPLNRQLYPRDLATNQATVPVNGQINTAGYDAMRLKVFRDATEIVSQTMPLVYIDSSAPFTFTAAITAELAAYAFEVYAVHEVTETAVKEATDVVAGDVFLINGQSNASAPRFTSPPEGAAYANDENAAQRPWIRSYGNSSAFPDNVLADQSWHIADGDTRNLPGSVGQWPMHLAAHIIDAYSIPIAILNGSQGRPEDTFPIPKIHIYLRNEADHDDTNTNYGRLLYRAQMAGATASARVMFWFQGESQEDEDAATYAGHFDTLRGAWHANYTALERIYVMQIRPYSCPLSGLGQLKVAETQRTLPDTYADVTVMSVNSLNGNDSCHYVYYNGYEALADRLFNLIAPDLYGALPAASAHPPNPHFAYFSNAGSAELTLVTRNQDDLLAWDPEVAGGLASEFLLADTAVTVTAGAAVSHTLVLALSGDGSAATGLTYRSHTGSGNNYQGPEPWVTNASGVGLLSFRNLPITPHPQASAVAIATNSPNAVLSWSHTTSNPLYEVHRHFTNPYFAPEASTWITDVLAPSSTYTDTSAIVDTSQNDYFLVRARTDLPSTTVLFAQPSNRVGIFHFSLTPGADE